VFQEVVMVRTLLLISLALLLLLPFGSAVQATGLTDAGPTSVHSALASPAPLSRMYLQNVRPIRVRFEGTVTQISPSETSAQWIVSGVEITVISATLVTPQDYQVTVGDWVQVKGVRVGEGPILAEEIHAQVGAIEAALVEFRGVIESIEPQPGDVTMLIVSGRAVIRGRSTEVEGDLVLGYLAEVRGEAQTDGVVFARRIVSSPPETVQRIVEFEGLIEQIQIDWWTIGGIRVWIAGAEIPRQGMVGLSAEVKGRQRNDGSVDAAMILVDELNPFQEVRLTGQVMRITQDSWSISVGETERIIYTSLNTFIDEGRAPAITGNLAEVLAMQRLDGTLLAIRIKLNRSG
jgi:hypothetical protein